LGWESGPLGYPVEDEVAVGDGLGRKQVFRGGHVYGSLAGLGSVRGRILERWLELGGPTGVLGYPVGDEAGTPDGRGRFSRFTGGMMYWTPQTDAWPVREPILSDWELEGYEKGASGYPISDVSREGDSFIQKFENGELSVKLINSLSFKEYSDGEWGDNYYRMQECIQGYDDKKPIVRFYYRDVRLYCKELQHIHERHFSRNDLSRRSWQVFQTCVALTLESEEPSGVITGPGRTIRTRFNDKTRTRSYAIYAYSSDRRSNYLVTAYTKRSNGPNDLGGNWGGCRRGLRGISFPWL
ncbi:MAG TPA: hypothetical protein H9867_00535, partial [Candidatus Corynebacterium gallistercoris]|nr:hypothetical protein [Candidatus Corynebacterium gallistercoris]